jgi:DNA-binding transcriptional ArsR family regulator
MKETEKELERTLKAFANRRRIAIVRLLKKQKEATVGEIAREIKLSFKSTSNHLGVLAGAGIVDKDQRSTLMFYHLAHDLPDATHRILAIL